MKVNERSNLIIDKLFCAHKDGKGKYILGTGSGAQILSEGLKKCGCLEMLDGYIIDDAYAKPDSFYSKPVFYIGEIDKQNGLLIINSIRNFPEDKKSSFAGDNMVFVDEDIMSLWSLDDFIDYKFFEDNKSGFESIYNLLNDEKSKDTFDAWINSKISGKKSYLNDIWSDDQYYVDEIIDFSMINSFVDCGAYDGDSFIAFINAYKKQMNKSYSGSAYLYEPDEDNYSKMVENVKGYLNVNCDMKGISNRYDVLTFTVGETTSSAMSDSGTAKITVDSLDNLITTKIDFVKMDIEGCEADAIEGMKGHIVNDRPILAICVYHKRNDLLLIPKLIRKYYDGYKFYLRAHKPWSQELVLYAIP